MKIDIAGYSYEGKWFDYEDGGKFLIRPFPASESATAFKDGAIFVSGEEKFKAFDYCLIGWKNFHDANDKPIPFTDKIKKKVYDLNIAGISDFVTKKVLELRKGKEEQEKNSEAGQSTDTPK